jgi:hypothetical protein
MSQPSTPQRPTPLSRDRIAEALSNDGYQTSVDSDGDLTGVWNGHHFWFILLGERDEILQVRGRCKLTIGAEQRSTAMLAINDWNRERIWPKAYLRKEDDGLALYGEMSVDLEYGVNDDQLARLLDCGLATAVQLFEATIRAQPSSGTDGSPDTGPPDDHQADPTDDSND